jgi:D-glycero-alpha-D-manno-heptose-7-phosphate kinase
MIVRARAPLRLGFGGGGTDVSPYCDQHGGYILNATIDRYAYAILEETNDQKVEFIASDQQRRWVGPAAPELGKDGELGLHRAVYDRVVRDCNQGRPLSLRMTTYCDAPAGSGLGSSSTLVVAMLKAYQELLTLPFGEYETASLAYDIERVDMGLAGGKQDQYAATFGGFNFMEFYGEGRVIVNPLRIKNWILSELEVSTLLYFTGISRHSAKIIDEQRRNIEEDSSEALEAMHGLKKQAVAMKEAILKGDFELLAKSMRQSWAAKKRTAQNITNPVIEGVLARAMEGGARAAKVSGAGGGGYIIVIVDPARRVEVIRALQSCGGDVMNCRFTKQGTEGWRTRW